MTNKICLYCDRELVGVDITNVKPGYCFECPNCHRWMNSDDLHRVPYVDVIASGYEWVCPKCNHLHKMIEIPRYNESVVCESCQKVVQMLGAEHAYA